MDLWTTLYHVTSDLQALFGQQPVELVFNGNDTNGQKDNSVTARCKVLNTISRADPISSHFLAIS